MRETLFILFVIGVLLGLTAIRYRKQIAAVLHIYRSLKSVRQQIKTQAPAQTPVESGRLVNCSKCGTWVPEERAIKLRNGTFYCSSACLETGTAAR